MDVKTFDMGDIDIAWCPGCGDFTILKILKMALSELEISPENLVTVSGIGQAAKIPQYFKTNFFNGLHGRALPVATAIKSSNPDITVIANSGDGDMYGEGVNHLIHTMRRNPDITNFVHNNMVYGLTKGQASPSSRIGFRTPVQTSGVTVEPFNPIATALSVNASFVARAFCGDIEQSKEIFKKAIQHKGYALVDIFQPCPTFNSANSFKWFKANTYYLEETYSPVDRVEAFRRAIESDKLPLGVFYEDNSRHVYHELLDFYKEDQRPAYKRIRDRRECLVNYLASKK